MYRYSEEKSMIQVLTYNGNEREFQGKDIVVNKLHDAQSLDEFEINVIDLKKDLIWRNKDNNKINLNILSDFNSLSTMISNRHDSKVIILLPQNIMYCYDTNYEGRYRENCELKDMLSSLETHLLTKLYKPKRKLGLTYENTKTKIANHEITASFYFNGEELNGLSLTHSIKSLKYTTVYFDDDVGVSTLNLTSAEELYAFLRDIHLIEDKEDVPGWIKEEKMFDD